MSRLRDLARRSPKEWALRLALAAVAAVLGCYSVTFSIAQVVVASNPKLAYRLAPYDGRITAALSTELAGEGAMPTDLTRAERLAKRALRQDPTAVAALATLGLVADARDNKVVARRYFTYAQKLSRRDLRTQLWMIEDTVARGDLSGAVRQYDITLRVFPTMGNLLYPVLAAAIGEPLVRAEVVKTLAAKPLWGVDFINFIASKGPDPQSTATLLNALRRAGVFVPETAQAEATNALVAAGRFDAAWSYYGAVHSNADRHRSRDPKFTAATETPSQFDWVTINDGSGLTTNIQGGIFDFAAPASVGGPMLQQLQLLSPGRYRLRGHTAGIEQAASAQPYWTLRCQDGRELGRVEVPNSSVGGGNFSGMFSVPAGCPVQTLLLTARPSDTVSGLSGQFDRVELAPAR